MDYVRRFRADQLVEHDRPDHLAMRKIVHGYFTPRTMESWRPFVRQAVAELLDAVQERGRMDVLTDLAAPLPVRVITAMMGVPPEDREHLRELADKLLYINRGEPDRLRPLTDGMQGMTEYVEPLVEARLARSGNDFISVLAQGERAGALTRHPGAREHGAAPLRRPRDHHEPDRQRHARADPPPGGMGRLRADPAGRTVRATEECLRYDSPVKSTQRIVAEDVGSFAGSGSGRTTGSAGLSGTAPTPYPLVPVRHLAD